jgi:hypothetical protein
MGAIKSTYTFLVGKPEGWKQFPRCMRRLEDNIKMDYKGKNIKMLTGYM